MGLNSAIEKLNNFYSILECRRTSAFISVTLCTGSNPSQDSQYQSLNAFSMKQIQSQEKTPAVAISDVGSGESQTP